MKNKNYVWVIEAKSSVSKNFQAFTSIFKDTYFTGIYKSRALARSAAKYMTENNQYNHPKFPLTVQYRVAKYKKL